MTGAGPVIGGAPVVTLTAGEGEGPRLVRATVAPGRGMLLLQLVADLPGRGEVELLATPDLDAAAAKLDGGPDDFNGNVSFSLGGAILLPFANRIRGQARSDRSLRAEVAGREVFLPLNWGGKGEGAEQYAMHGLMLDRPFEVAETAADRVTADLDAGDFGDSWPSRTRVRVEYALTPERLSLTVTAANAGDEVLPMGIGWHPWFALPSGRREQAVLTVPGAARALVNNYDEVLPTGRVESVIDTPYDFRGGRPLGDLYLDDCFLAVGPGPVRCRLADPASGLGLYVEGDGPINAVQVYAPTDRPVAVIEPQYNRADPFGAAWGDGSTGGMVLLQPGEATTYRAAIGLIG